MYSIFPATEAQRPDGKTFSKGAGKPPARPPRDGGKPDRLREGGARDGGAPKAAKPGKAERKPDRKPDRKAEVGRDQTLRLKEGAGKPKQGKKPFRKGARPAGGGKGGKGGGFGGSQPLRRRSGDAARPARGRS